MLKINIVETYHTTQIKMNNMSLMRLINYELYRRITRHK